MNTLMNLIFKLKKFFTQNITRAWSQRGVNGFLQTLQERQNKILTTLQSPVLLTLNHKHCNHRHTCMNEYLCKKLMAYNTMKIFLNIFRFKKISQIL